jgi:hypothetical protein
MGVFLRVEQPHKKNTAISKTATEYFLECILLNFNDLRIYIK